MPWPYVLCRPWLAKPWLVTPGRLAFVPSYGGWLSTLSLPPYTLALFYKPGLPPLIAAGRALYSKPRLAVLAPSAAGPALYSKSGLAAPSLCLPARLSTLSLAWRLLGPLAPFLAKSRRLGLNLDRKDPPRADSSKPRARPERPPQPQERSDSRGPRLNQIGYGIFPVSSLALPLFFGRSRLASAHICATSCYFLMPCLCSVRPLPSFTSHARSGDGPAAKGPRA